MENILNALFLGENSQEMENAPQLNRHRLGDSLNSPNTVAYVHSPVITWGGSSGSFAISLIPPPCSTD
jgi:hypothetical protein